MANEKITIKMVSEKAQVSKTTVSRFLNGKYEFMSESTKKRIEAVIKELDYRPNAMAQSLKSNKTGLIGLVIADMTHPLTSLLIKGINDACEKQSFQLIITDADNDPAKEREKIQSLIDRQVEGIIINATGGNEDFIHTLQQQGNKIVLADCTFADHSIDSVTIDYEKATSELLKKVYAEGFEKVAFFSQPLQDRLAKKKHGDFIEVTERFVKHTSRLTYIIDENNDMLEECQDLIHSFLQAHKDEYLAIFAESSVVTANLLVAIYQMGLKIPEDIGICGYDELGWIKGLTGNVSTISKPAHQIGSEAAELLFKRINKQKEQYKPKHIEIPARITLTDSTQLTDNNFDKIVIKLNQANKPFIK
ncbi:MAG: LacI family transcriptional regulator [Turicibacter sp.]|nr:LacI family transcriptional regulator [Turicibacter sp.]